MLHVRATRKRSCVEVWWQQLLNRTLYFWCQCIWKLNCEKQKEVPVDERIDRGGNASPLLGLYPRAFAQGEQATTNETSAPLKPLLCRNIQRDIDPIGILKLFCAALHQQSSRTHPIHPLFRHHLTPWTHHHRMPRPRPYRSRPHLSFHLQKSHWLR